MSILALDIDGVSGCWDSRHDVPIWGLNQAVDLLEGAGIDPELTGAEAVGNIAVAGAAGLNIRP